MFSCMRRCPPQLPMYSSRFRQNGALISAPDICNGLGQKFLAKDHHYHSDSHLPSPFPTHKFERFLPKDLFSVACDMHGLTFILDFHARNPKRIGVVEREFFEDTYVASQIALVAFPYPTPDASMSSYRHHCWRMAALIYFNTAVRKWEKETGALKDLTSQLINALQSSNLSESWSPFCDVLLWVLFLGHCGALAEMEKGWFALEIKRALRALDVRTFEKFEGVLGLFLYRITTFHNALLNLWKEVK